MRPRLSLVVVVLVGCIAMPFAASAQNSPLSSRYLFTQANASAPAPIVRAGDDKVADEYIVVFKDDVVPEQVFDLANQLAAQFGATVKKVWSHTVKGVFVQMSEAQAQAITEHPLIKYVEENAEWHLSAGPYQTNINPKTCDPTAGTCPTVVDDRLWHLDRADQNYASPTSTLSYCTDGTGVTVYVVDTGINKFHNEFAPSGTRVQPGVNTSGDFMPADDPCMGFAIPPSGSYSYLETPLYPLGAELRTWNFGRFRARRQPSRGSKESDDGAGKNGSLRPVFGALLAAGALLPAKRNDIPIEARRIDRCLLPSPEQRI